MSEVIPLNTNYMALVQPEAIEVAMQTHGEVRAANIEDIDALVRVELTAFKDVYGDNPSFETREEVRAKYERRVNTLGDWVRVIDHPERGVFGMMVLCPTDLDRSAFESMDMTANPNIESAFNPNGKNAYIVNLAIEANPQLGNRFDLFADAISMGQANGIEKAFFESRLPGFHKWIKKTKNIDEQEIAPQLLDKYADEYWQEIVEVAGCPKPKDILLRLYTDFGATPIKLIGGAWMEDSPSKAYGVLCEYEVPKPNEKKISERDSVELNEEYGIVKKAWAAIKGRKNAILYGSAVPALAYEVATNPLGRVVHELGTGDMKWAASGYALSMATYLGGGAMMLAGATGAVGNPFSIRKQYDQIAQKAKESQLIRSGFWLNRSGAIGAAMCAGAAVVLGLPPEAWSPLGAAGLDLYSTIALGKWFHDKALAR